MCHRDKPSKCRTRIIKNENGHLGSDQALPKQNTRQGVSMVPSVLLALPEGKQGVF